MTETSDNRWAKPMKPRDPHEQGRAATSLELLFDLCFVVAIALGAAELHHGLVEAHFADAVTGYAMVFFAIWWAWMGFTWLASGYDNDDAPYRAKVLIQMVGVLILAAGVPRAAHHQDFTFIVLGYIVMRVGLLMQWARAARNDPANRRLVIRQIVGISICQAGWAAFIFTPASTGVWVAGWVILVMCELAVPYWASMAGRWNWHAHHISERYGLLTIIVIGESVLAITLAIQSALDAGDFEIELGSVILGAPFIMFSMWWLYFLLPAPAILTSTKRAFLWGYGHYFVYASAAAVGAALAASVDIASGKGHLSPHVAGLVIGVPVCVYLISVWLVQVQLHKPHPVLPAGMIATGAGCIGAAWTPYPVAVIGLLLFTLVGICVITLHVNQAPAK